MDEVDHMIEVVFRCKVCKLDHESLEEIRSHLSSTHLSKIGDETLLCNKVSNSSGTDIKNLNKTEMSLTMEVSIIVDQPDELIGGLNSISDVQEQLDSSDIADGEIEKSGVHSPAGYSVARCSESSVNMSVLKRNQRTRSIASHQNICDLCSKPFPGVEELELHRSTHWGNGLFKCSMCDYLHTECSRVEDHMLTHSETKMFECDDCGLTFSSQHVLRNHWRLNHLGGKHLCDVCGFEAQSKYVLFQHKMKCTPNTFKCQLCEFTTDNAVDLKEHSLLRHSSGFICKRCVPKQTFATKEELLSHTEESHAGKACYFCDKCNFVAKLPNHLRKHCMIHTGERPSKCTVKGCNFSTRNPSYLKHHVAKIHGGPDDIVCKLCSYVTKTQHQLDLHVALHHMKVYKCQDCTFEGKSTTALRRHRLRKHVDPNEMRYKCPNCSYRTQFRDSINKHLLTHEIRKSKHRCVICKSIFPSIVDLKSHIFTSHNKDAKKVLFCDQCSYTTERSSNLQLHISRRHSVKTPLKCSNCSYQTKCHSSLRLHLLRKHQEDMT